ncbi:hypothetical protein RGQ29_001289 [Quercus rubra]|uniref:Uncharacterized protein n=1 Tax=Quercus rubra TaxID=3512 RepID=A0AAN7GCL8_QUERU|nr:hypothetical protein RGQ29_001289 [Quercus rubra]
MATRFAQRQLIIPNENFDVHPKKTTKKGDRKALNDITNKSSNIRRLLHDHKKCIESQQLSGMNSFYLDLVLPGHDSVCTAENQESKQAKADLYGPRCYPEPVELPMADLLDWTSPPCSPLHWDAPPHTPFGWESEVVEFVLKQEADI